MLPRLGVILLDNLIKEDAERAVGEVPLNICQYLPSIHSRLLLGELIPILARRRRVETVNLESQPRGEGRKVLELVHDDKEDPVAEQRQAVDYVHDAADLRDGEADVLAGVVKLREAAQAAEDDRAAF